VVEFVADNPGLTLFHCHQQLHFGFMALFEYVRYARAHGVSETALWLVNSTELHL
jgi:hypothetical protein